MSVSLTSPDGSMTIKQITVDGKSYDLPPWIEESEFVKGLSSQDDENPFSSLRSCTLARWDTLEAWNDDKGLAPTFALEYFVPFGGIRELIVNAFTPVNHSHSSEFGDEWLQTEVVEDGVLVRFLGFEYFDFNDIQVFLLPEVKDVTYTPSPGTDPGENWLSEMLEEFKRDPREFVKDVTGWDGYYERVPGPDDAPYTLLVKVHED